MRKNETGCRLDSAVQVVSADDRFQRIGKIRFFTQTTGVFFAFTDKKHGIQLDVFGDEMKVLLAYDIGFYAWQAVLFKVRIIQKKILVDDELQYGIAKKFQSFIIKFNFLFLRHQNDPAKILYTRLSTSTAR